MHMLFVYGSLMRGGHNDHFLDDAKFVGCGHTLDGFVMWGWGFPLVLRRKAGHQVAGELYEVNDLRRIDRLEGHPHGYRRTRINVRVNGRTHRAWMYIIQQINVHGTPNPDVVVAPVAGLLRWVVS